MAESGDSFDFIVVGSGAGGGVLASRLARNDKNLTVLLLEAGSEPTANPTYPVPAFHPSATEDADLRWDYFVEHFSNPELAREDDKRSDRGIFYPRASALGGCTAHHAMITVYPDPSDWDYIAKLTGDESWSSTNMWRYFERCRNDSDFGWLSIEAAGLDTVLRAVQDPVVDAILLAAVTHAPHLLQQLWRTGLGNIHDLLTSMGNEPEFDPNHPDTFRNREGVYRIPLSTKAGKRHGVTEFINATKNHPRYGQNLTIWQGKLVASVIFDNGRVDGVKYADKKRAYRADREAKGDESSLADFNASLKIVSARKEVILSAGAFNTPQLLMLSGIGPEAQLREKGIAPLVPHDGVGRNLQDRYEIPVIDDVGHEFKLLSDYPFDAYNTKGDRGFTLWERQPKEGFYTTNGGTIGIMRRSQGGVGDCDLLIFGIPGEFAGYRLGYSGRIRMPEGRSRFSWIILKAHTQNNGEVHLETNDPRDPPVINLRSFHDGQGSGDPDLDALEWAVGKVRQWMQPLRKAGVSQGEFLPGPNAEDAPNLRHFIMTHAWGHHASCTCPIGDVLDKDFRVVGAPGNNLRVVDASVFPKIPGYFIVLPVYMIAEKAADVILAAYDAKTMSA
jgi:choline dehydrogenase